MPSYLRQQKHRFGSLRTDPHWSTKGLVFYSQFKPAGKLIDETAFKNDGIITGATWVRDGLSFDGINQYVNCGGASGVFDITGAITLIAYIKTTTTLATTSRVIGKGENGGERGYFLAYRGSDNILFIGTNENSMRQTAPVSITDGGIHQIAATYNGNGNDTGYSIYADGRDIGALIESGVAGDFESTTQPLLIAAEFDDGALDHPFEGDISYVLIYNRALNAGEILQLYRTPDLPLQQDLSWMGGITVLPSGIVVLRRRRECA